MRLATAVQPAPAAPTTSCCGHGSCCSKESKPKPVPAPNDDCPCRKNAAPCGSFVATPVKAASFDASFAIAAIASDVTPVSLPPVTLAYAPLRDLPFLTVSDLLHAQHRLRC